MEKKSNNFMKVHAYIFNKIQSQSMDKFCFLRSGMISFQKATTWTGIKVRVHFTMRPF